MYAKSTGTVCIYSKDSLSDLQNRFNEKELQQLEREARIQAENQKLSAVDQALNDGKAKEVVVTIDPARLPKDWLLYTTKLLSNSLSHDVAKLEKLTGTRFVI